MADKEREETEVWDWGDCFRFWGLPWLVLLIISLVVLIILRLM